MRLDPAPAAAARLTSIDAARGVAIAAMIVYHFSWDLRFFGFIDVDIGRELGWHTFARLIAGSFLFLVGVGLALAAERGINWPRYWRRLLLIAASAVAITIATWFAFPESFIFFGILHCIAASSVLGLLFLRVPVVVVLATAALCAAAPSLFASPFFDQPALQWLGLMTYFPNSNDYVPVLPWFAAVLVGIAAARLLRGRRRPAASLPSNPARPFRILAWAGRHSLPIYLIHQPVLLALLYGVAWIAPPDRAGALPGYIASCTEYCLMDSADRATCEAACGCLAREAQAGGIWPDVLANTLDANQTNAYREMAGQCRAEAQGG